MSTSQPSILTRAARSCAALAAAAALWAGIAPECQAQVPPPNDNIANAQALIGVSGTVYGTNLFATAQTNEPAPYPGNLAGASIWYSWTAPITTTIDFKTRGSTTTNGAQLQTVMAVYRLKAGSTVAVTNLTLVAQNKNDPNTNYIDSRVDFAANRGTFYLIQVDGASSPSGPNAQGYISLTWSSSLVAGTFQFTTSEYLMGAADDGFLVQGAGSLAPSVHNNQGTNNGRITITRTGGYTGRCEVQLIVTNSSYTNFYLTNITGTNIYITNFNAAGMVTSFTNILYTNTAVEEEIADTSLGGLAGPLPVNGLGFYYTFFTDTTNTLTDNNGASFNNLGFQEITNLFTEPCANLIGEVSFATNIVTGINGNVTNIVATQTNVFCTTTTGEAVVPSAVDGAGEIGGLGGDYLSTDSTNLTFDDFQMSQDIYLNLPGWLFAGEPPGPQYPEVYGANASVNLILTNVVLDPLEDQDIIPPTISKTLGSSIMEVLNLANVSPGLGATNLGVPGLGGFGATLNFERATFRVNKPQGTGTNAVQTNTIWVIREPSVWPYASTLHYTMDSTELNITTLDWNHFLTVAGSDYAIPSVNGLPDFDFFPTYTGVAGQLTFPANAPGVEGIQVVVTNNGAQEFDSDVYVQLYETVGDAEGNDNPMGPTFLGNINTANFTINFYNPNPGVEPGGAWDRTFNPDSASNSIPPFNTVPGANAPVQAIGIQPNGQVVIGGDFTSFDDATNTAYITRMTANGYPDSTFYSGSGPNGTVDAIAIDPAGNIYIGGQFTSINGKNAFHIARLTPSGALDSTFSKGNGFNQGSSVWALAIDGSGNILVGGSFTNFNTTNCNHIARLLPSGELDTSFLPSTGAPNTGTDSDVRAIATDGNGNVILGGLFTHVNGTNWSHVARLLTNGVADNSFNPGFGPDNAVYCVAIQPNNNYILIGGAFANYNLQTAGSIARLTYNGALDTTFATGTGANGAVYSVMVQPNSAGSILIGGQFTSYDTTRRVGIARILSNGWLDTTFLDTAYNQFAGFINHYYNVSAVNLKDLPAEYNSINLVSAMGYDLSSNIVVGGSFIRVGGGYTRDQVRFQQNVTRLIAAPTPGPETGGIGNAPGNIGLTQNTYSVGDTDNKLYITLDRQNGSLGPVAVTLGTNTFPPGPGSATDADFGLATASAEYHDVWDFWEIEPNGSYAWRVTDGYYGFNYAPQPPDSDNGDAGLGLIIHNDPSAGENLNASLSLLNLTSFGLLTLGGQTIPTGPALGLPNAGLEIINNNFPAGTLGFSATNYTVVNTAGTVTITVLRTNGSTGQVSVNYTTVPGFTNGAGTNVATTANYVPTSGQLTFPPGILSESFTVTINDLNVLVPTTFFNVVLSDPTGTASLDTNNPPLVPSTTVVEIIDGNFQPGHLEFSAPSYSALKGSPATITVNRVGGALGQLTVQYATSNGTASANTNYTSATGTLTWDSQIVTPQTFTVQTLQDNVVEGNKTVNLSLFNPVIQGAAPGSATNMEVLTYPSNAVLTINDTDSYGTLSFSVANYNVLQNAGSALITVVRTGGTVGSVSVNFTTLDGTNATAPFQPAYAGTNYGPTSNQLTFAAGVSSVSFTIPIYNTTTTEAAPANRIVNLVLFNGSPGIAGQFPKMATLTILDPQLVLSPAGSVDQTIQNGVGFNTDVQSLSLQPDGSLLAGGDFTFFNGFPFNYIGRLLPDANFDSAFVAVANSTVCQVLSQAPTGNHINGSVMMVGEFTQVDQVPSSGIARLNLNGSLDESFNPGSGADSTVYAIAEQFLPAPQTNLPAVPYYVIGGNFANFDGATASGVARVTAAGLLDPNFSVGAGVTGTNAAIHAIALEPNNQILVGGDFTAFNNAPHHHLVRLNIDGSVDTNFAAFDGTSSDINGSVRAVQVQPDGNILIGGLFTTVSGSNFNFIARLNNNGTVDTNFNVGVGCNNGVLALALDSQNRILVGGEFTRASGVTRNGITRLNPDGTVDPTINFGFGANGYVDSIVLETNDEIDVAGAFTTFNNFPENNFVRLYGGANAGDGSLEFSQQIFGALESATNAVITIERIGGEGTLAQPTVTAEFSTADSTNGFNGTNYVAVTTNIVFPYGETFETVTVPLINTPAVAPNAIVNLILTNATNVAIGPQSSAILVITNVNTALSFSAATYRQSANAAIGFADIQVVRTGNPNSSCSVTVYTGAFAGSDAAVPGVNYTAVTNVLYFTPGLLTVDWQVPITNAPSQFEDLSVALDMTGVSNAIISSPSSATLVIASVNNAPGVLAFAQTNYVVSEGGTNAAITIVRTNGTEGTVSATLTTSNLTAVAGLNYTGLTNFLVTFDAGVTVQTVLIPVDQLSTAGPNNVTASLTLSNPQNNATIGSPSQATLTIQNDLENFSFSQASYGFLEGTGTVNLSILRNGPTNDTVTVYFSTYSPPGADDTNGYAVPGVDYSPVSSTPVKFFPGQVLQSIPIDILQGNTPNGLVTFQIILQTNAASGAQLGSPSTATVIITSDVTGFTLAANSYTVGENGSNVVITVNRINPNTGTVSVQYATSDNTALNGQDYVANSGTITFQNGQATTNISIQILNPNKVETSNEFNFTLSQPTNNSYLVAPSSAVIIITNVNSGISFGSPSFSVSECGGTATIPVIRTGVTNGSTSVHFGTSDISGKAGLNYVTTNGTLSFTNGQTVQTFSVEIINNHIVGPNHTVQLSLSNPTNALLLNPSAAILTIDECNGSDIVASGTAFVTGSILPGTGAIYSNDVVTILFGLRDISGFNTTNLVATLLETNGITNVQSTADYGVLLEYGPTKAEPFTFTAIGSNGQNIIATLALQDGTRQLTNVAFGFTIGGSTISFTNPQPLTFSGGTNLYSPTNPPTRATNSFPPGYGYPSLIDVTGVVGTMTAVTATLNDFAHTYPQDLNVVLEDPSGQTSILMSRCGGGISVSNLVLTFDQSAPVSVPLDSAITDGTYKPTTNPAIAMTPLATVPSSEQNVPSAPLGPFGADLGVFVGGVPNGNWALWIDDNESLDSGYVSNGWTLNVSIGTPVENDSDLELTITPSTTNATLSNTLVYYVTLTNYGPSSATNVVISNAIPSGLAYVSNSCNCGVSSNGEVLTFAYPSLAVGAGTSFGITMLPTNLGYATITIGAFADEADPNSNNVVTSSVLVSSPEADLGITMTEATDPVLAGGYVSYSIIVTNNGPSDATGVSATIALPNGFSVVSISPAGGASNTNGTITWNIGTLGASPASSITNLTVVARPMIGGIGLATAIVSSDVYDPTKLNNFSSVKTEVDQPAISVSTASQTYTLTWPATATNFVLEGAVELSPNTTWVPITSPPPPVISGQYNFALPGSTGYHFFRLSTQP